jgi:hypothetical protein
MSVLEKRIAYLGLADIDYLSARLLLLSGLVTTGFPKAAEAFEKLLKLFLLLEAKISSNVDLTEKQMKAYSHNLIKLFDVVKTKIPNTQFDQSWDDYFKILQDSYTRRYPENWTVFQITYSLGQLDKGYVFFRNGIIGNFPPEEQARVREFGTFIYDAYRGDRSKIIKDAGSLTPAEIFKLRNDSFNDFDIDVNNL